MFLDFLKKRKSKLMKVKMNYIAFQKYQKKLDLIVIELYVMFKKQINVNLSIDNLYNYLKFISQ